MCIYWGHETSINSCHKNAKACHCARKGSSRLAKRNDDDHHNFRETTITFYSSTLICKRKCYGHLELINFGKTENSATLKWLSAKHDSQRRSRRTLGGKCVCVCVCYIFICVFKIGCSRRKRTCPNYNFLLPFSSCSLLFILEALAQRIVPKNRPHCGISQKC